VTKPDTGERNVDCRLQVPVEEDGGGNTRENWMRQVVCGLWCTRNDKAYTTSIVIVWSSRCCSGTESLICTGRNRTEPDTGFSHLLACS